MKQLRAISRSIVALKRQLRLAVKELNEEAAKLLTRGKYESSAALVEAAKRTRQFVADVEALRQRWKAVRSGGGKEQSGDKTPLWEYYSLVARALVALGGNATRAQVMEWINQHGTTELKPGDLARTPRGRVIWQRNLGRAKRAMLKEGYLEPGNNRWTLTRLGQEIVARQDGKS